jgi:hypothetical protein
VAKDRNCPKTFRESPQCRIEKPAHQLCSHTNVNIDKQNARHVTSSFYYVNNAYMLILKNRAREYSELIWFNIRTSDGL